MDTIYTIEISEHELDGQKIYHWTIYTADGYEVCHSAYHTDRERCEEEAHERLSRLASAQS